MLTNPTSFLSPTWVTTVLRKMRKGGVEEKKIVWGTVAPMTPEAAAAARGLTGYMSLIWIARETRKKPMTVMTNFVMVRGMPDIRFPMMTNTHGPVTDSTGLETTARVSLWAVPHLNRVPLLPTWPWRTLRRVRTLGLEC